MTVLSLLAVLGFPRAWGKGLDGVGSSVGLGVVQVAQ